MEKNPLAQASSRTIEGHLDLDLLETVLPDDNIGGDTVLTVVEEDNPKQYKSDNNITRT